MPERRIGDRRTWDAIPEPLSRKGERRQEERRDSPRRAIALDVREPGSKGRSCLGDLSVSGAAFVTPEPPTGDLVELRFTLPTYEGPITATGYVVARTAVPRGTMVSVAFADIEVDAQLAIAQWFDEEDEEDLATSPP